MMSKMQSDANTAMMLDGNAVAGLLQDLFMAEMTASVTQCASCGRTGDIGALLAFTQAPGVVLRCPDCEQVVLRIAVTLDAVYLDARGATSLRVPR
jgi:hypothetical protein